MKIKIVIFLCLISSSFFIFANDKTDKLLQQRISSYEKELAERDKIYNDQLQEYESQIEHKNETIRKLESEKDNLEKKNKLDFETFKSKQQEKYNLEISKKEKELTDEYEKKYNSSVKKFIEKEKKEITKKIQKDTLLFPKIIIILLMFIFISCIAALIIYLVINSKKEESLYNEYYDKLKENYAIDTKSLDKKNLNIYKKCKDDFIKEKKIQKTYDSIKIEKKGIDKLFSIIEKNKNDKETLFYLCSGFRENVNKIKTKCNAVCKDIYPLSPRVNVLVTKTFYGKVSDELYDYRDKILKMDIDKDNKLDKEILSIANKYKEIADEIKSYGRVK